ATDKLAAARRWAAETLAKARDVASRLFTRVRTAAANAWSRAVTAGRALARRIGGRVRKLITQDLPTLGRRIVTWAKGKVRNFRDRLVHVWNQIKERGYRLAQKVGISKPTIGHAKPWSAMTPAERKAFQHSYDRHRADFNLPNWSGKNAESLRQQFTAECAAIRANAQRITVEYKPVGVKGSGVSGGIEPVRFFHYTKPDGTRWYYYETLNGRFVSAGKNRP
ncbi:MAG: hypothetical protein LC799_15195, partial [Actinobacteria bacterium]|nr:hypothetical protein [Actinomycetota bacterium]